jgi:transposase
MREWLPAGHPVWLVIAAVEQLDTSAFHRHRRTGGVGRAGYDPDMLLTLLMWGWAQGVRSSRRIERACEQDVAFRVICAGDAPDHTVIARFRAAAASACEDMFAQVLALCARLGMGQLGVVALDGVKIASNASMAANRSEEGLHRAAAAARVAAAEHAAADAAEDDLFGPGDRGDRVPDEVTDPASREGRIAAALADLAAEREAEQTARTGKAERWLAERDRREGRHAGRPPADIEVEVLTARLERDTAAREAFVADYWSRRAAAEAAGTRDWGREPVQRTAYLTRLQQQVQAAQARQAKRDARAAGQRRSRNITDPQSRPMPLRGGGWLQGYNCQAVTSSDGLIIAVSVSNNPSDVITYTAMAQAAVTAAEMIDAHRPRPGPDRPAGIGTIVADAGYLSADNLTAPGPDRIIAVGKAHAVERAARDNPAIPATDPANPTDPVQAMAHRLRTPEGIATYRQRAHIAETPFGHAKHNLGFRRFTSRGLDRATAEWHFHAAVQNLFKAITTGHLAIPAT